MLIRQDVDTSGKMLFDQKSGQRFGGLAYRAGGQHKAIFCIHGLQDFMG